MANPCEKGETVCRLIYQWTGSEPLAESSDVLVTKPLAVLGLLLLALVVRWVAHRLIDRVVRRAAHAALPPRVGERIGLDRLGFQPPVRRLQRAEAMGGLFKSVVTGLIVAVFGTMMLSEIGVDIAPIIASAGIVGIALGFGAQSLVKDFLSGIFIILEDQYGVGDSVDLGEAIGTVEAVSMRMTRVRDVNGTVWYVPNGEIVRVGNQSQNWARTVLDVSVAYHEDLARVRRVLADVAHSLWEEEDFKHQVIEEPSVWGVQDLGPDGVTVRVVLKTTPGEQWAIAREMRERIKARFDHEGIEMPFPQRVVWQRTDAGDGTGSGADTGTRHTGVTPSNEDAS
ncbi:mechanosensitive ion channel family protein [Nocardioides sp. R-C-SC26]|uniref:mechanosensitive ion channel family protein n=1 Tax=Nocardioides sp. R-C-SC26 TaxID=2870414 RepID=UPI001E2ED6DB|nr:mechanosensitive ion channel family protein [Nocardioides sp. R-C-SC26]